MPDKTEEKFETKQEYFQVNISDDKKKYVRISTQIPKKTTAELKSDSDTASLNSEPSSTTSNDTKETVISEVSNMEVLMTLEEKNKFLRTVKDPQYHAEKSCCTYIFQQELAGYFQTENKELAEFRKELAELQHETSASVENTRDTIAQIPPTHITTAKEQRLIDKITKHEQSQRFMTAVHGLSTEFIAFEKLIHNPSDPNDPAKSIADLKTAINTFNTQINAKIQALKEKLLTEAAAQNPKMMNDVAIKKLCDNLKNTITVRTTAFSEKLDRLKHPTHEEMNDLFSMHNVGKQGEGLGLFSARCMMDVRTASIDMLYKMGSHSYFDGAYDAVGASYVTRGRIAQSFGVSSAISALSDAGANINYKMFTISGAEHDSHRKTPQAMIDALTLTDDELTARENGKEKTSREWVSMTRYTASPNNMDKVDETFCLATGLDSTDATKKSVPARKLLFGFMDLIPATLRLMGQVILTPFAIAEQMIRGENENNITTQIGQWFSKIHHDYSLSRNLQQELNDSYKRNAENTLATNENTTQNSGKTDDENKPQSISHQNLLKKSVGEPQSTFNKVLTEYSADKMAGYVRAGVSSAWDFVAVNPWETAKYLFGEYTKSSEKAYRDVMNSDEVQAQLAEAEHMETLMDSLKDLNQQALANLRDELRHNPQGDDLTVEELEKFSRALEIAYRKNTDISSPLEVLQEIMEGLSDTIVDKMFRKSPAFATAYFMVATTTLGTFVAPSAFIWMKSAIPVLQAVPQAISPVFTGQPLGSLTQQTISCFLEWKLSFFSSELATQGAQGKLGYLKELCNDPEKLALGMAALIATGVLTQFIPLLPSTINIGGTQMMNPYADVLNFFIEESKSCSNMAGMNPARGLEFAFLGLKFGLLIKSMLTGTHKGKETELQALIKELHDKGVFQAYPENSEVDKEKEKRLATLKAILDANSVFSIEEKAKLTEFVTTSLNNIPANTAVVTQDMTTLKENNPIDINSEKVDNIKKSDTASTKISNKHFSQLPLDEAHKELRLALLTMKSVNLKDKLSRGDKLKFYDRVYHLQAHYNSLLQKAGRFDKVEKLPTRALKDFYNQYCYKGSNTLMRIISVIPFYPVTVAVRGLKWLAAVAFDKPAMRHSVNKSFAKDIVIGAQLLGMTNRTAVATERALDYTGRTIESGIAIVGVAGNAAIKGATGKNIGLTAEAADDFVTQSHNAHRATAGSERRWSPIRSFINRQADLADANSDLSVTTDISLTRLEKIPPKSIHVQRENTSKNDLTHNNTNHNNTANILCELNAMKLTQHEKDYLEIRATHHANHLKTADNVNTNSTVTPLKGNTVPTADHLFAAHLAGKQVRESVREKIDSVYQSSYHH